MRQLTTTITIEREVEIRGYLDGPDSSVGYAGGATAEEAFLDGKPIELTDAEWREAEAALAERAENAERDAYDAAQEAKFDAWKDGD